MNILFTVLLFIFFQLADKMDSALPLLDYLFSSLQTLYLQNNRFHFFLLNIFTSQYHFYLCILKCLSSAESQQTLQRNSHIYFMENTSEYTVQKASITSGTEDNTVVSCFLWGCFPMVEVVVPVSVSHLHSFESVT